MRKEALKHEDVLNYITKLPHAAFKDVIYHYAQNNHIDVSPDIESLTIFDLQKRLEKLNINKVCPTCGSIQIIKNGKRKNIQRFKCKDCNTQFTLFTNTILEKTKWHWNIWVKVLEMTLNNYSLESIRHTLIDDYGYSGLDHKTVFLWRHKILNALASFPQPVLSGIVQVDETFIRESQKGSRNLKNYMGKNEVREPRYGRFPSKYGTMGPEFATVTTAIDNTGHCVCKVTGLGKLTPDVFVDTFENHFNSPAYICTDANFIYKKYCDLFKIPHYERPSEYMTRLKKSGYITPSRINQTLAEQQRIKNNKILLKLYNDHGIDNITNKGFISYKCFNEIKKDNGLNLARVNGLHNEIKRFICKNMTNVSTKYLQAYMGYFSFLHNWKVDKKISSFSRKDAEAILIEMIKNQTKYTSSDLKNTKLNMPKPSSRYTLLLKEQTLAARKATNNRFFKFDEEDNVISFDKRKYLSEQPNTKLKRICKKHGIKYKCKWAKWSIISIILKQPDIGNIIIELIDQDKHIKISEEDREYINHQEYKTINST